MAEQELVEIFDKTDYDEKGNIKLPPQPRAAAKPTRPTVAGLKKELDELKADVEESVRSWLGELEIRLEALEKGTAKHNEALLSDVKTRLDILDQGSLSDRADVAADISARLDNQDTAIGALANALRSHLEELAATPPEPAQELEFAQPPQRAYDEQTRTEHIAGMANVCQTMADVLLICRYLKEDPELTDAERTEILNIACRSSGVIIAPGLQIRAGVKFSGA